MSWLSASHRRSPENSPRSKGLEGHRSTMEQHQSDWGLTIDLPPPPTASFTLAQSRTPGWDSPWTARAARNGHSQAQDLFGYDEDEDEKLTRWSARKKSLRRFVFTNTYVPLVSRRHNLYRLFTENDTWIALSFYKYIIHNCCACHRYSNTNI